MGLYSQPQVAVTVVLVRDGRLLLGLRAADLDWGLPGGKLEPGEHPQECARRELAEETGLQVAGDLDLIPFVANSLHPDRGEHWLVLFYAARWSGGEPRRCEPHKCLEWRWCDPGDPPQPLFTGAARLLGSGVPIFG